MRTKWFKNAGERTPEETASALGFIFWQIAKDRLMHLRKAEFDIFSAETSIKVLGEFAAFLTHIADRKIYVDFNSEDRAAIIQLVAKKVSVPFCDNALDAVGPGPHEEVYFEMLNNRLAAYSELSGEGESLNYSLSRALAGFIERHVSDKDKSWVASQLIEVEIPVIFEKFDKAYKDLMGD